MLFVFTMTLCNISFSQIEIEKYGDYKLSAYKQPLGLFSNVSSAITGQRFFIQVISGFDATEFYFPNREMFSNFVSAVEKSLPIYEQWCEIAKNNSVHFFATDMGIKEIESYLFFIYNGNQYRTGAVRMNPMFYVDKNGKCFVVIETPRIAQDKWIPFDDYRLFGYEVAQTESVYEFVQESGDRLVFSSSKKLVDSRCRLIFSSAAEISELLAKLKEMLKLSDDNVMQSKLFK